jgi:hypothetical protein
VCFLLLFVSNNTRSQIVEKALTHIEEQVQKGNKEFQVINELSEELKLYRVAKIWRKDLKLEKYAWELFEFLADTHHHVYSLATLAFKSVEQGFTMKALRYFQLAGEFGPHHASLFNAGRILADLESPDLSTALAYLRSASTLHRTHPEHAQESVTKLALEAYDVLSRQIANSQISLQQSAHIFLYAALYGLPEEADAHWRDAMLALIKFNETFVESEGRTLDSPAMLKAVTYLRKLWESHSRILSPLQRHLVLVHINTILGPLTGSSDDHIPTAARYAESLANSHYCFSNFSVSEKDPPGCFNVAVSTALNYYRRIKDDESIQRVVDVANLHPQAATKWTSSQQAPHVFHPKLTSKPWWNPEDFSAATTLSSLFQDQQWRQRMLDEIVALKSLQEGKGVRSDADSVEISVSGTTKSFRGTPGLQRINSRHTSVRTSMESISQEGAGAWAQFGPLFDGIYWDARKCQVVPSICKSLQDDKSLCTSQVSRESLLNGSKSVRELCGSNGVISILRLRPGTGILPHCGITNSRLIMHFPLVGADGVQITVGDKTVEGYNSGDGNAIVFDDSFEHSVFHGGRKDRFVVRVILHHPDLLQF